VAVLDTAGVAYEKEQPDGERLLARAVRGDDLLLPEIAGADFQALVDIGVRGVSERGETNVLGGPVSASIASAPQPPSIPA